MDTTTNKFMRETELTAENCMKQARMARGEKCKMTVTFEVKEAQGLALQAMFEYWNRLANWGSSRFVSFFCDGDGDFKPNCQISFDKPVRPLTDEMREKAVAEHTKGSGEHLYDFDPICWILRREDEK